MLIRELYASSWVILDTFWTTKLLTFEWQNEIFLIWPLCKPGFLSISLSAELKWDSKCRLSTKHWKNWYYLTSNIWNLLINITDWSITVEQNIYL